MTATTITAPARRRSRPAGVALALATIAAFFLLLGGALLMIHLTQRDDGGYFASSKFGLNAPGYAISSEQLDLAGGGDSNLAKNAAELSGKLRVKATSADGKPIFVGIARQTDADRYLGGVAQDEVVDAAGSDSKTVTRPGRPPSGAPTDQRIWQASSSGAGTRTMTWKIRPGRWTVAVMNADASRGVHADLGIGLKTRLFLWIGLAGVAAALVLGGAAALRVATDRRHPDA